MPPSAKFTKEEIISAAFDIVEQEGRAALTARSLGNKLGCSTRPIFTVFGSMDEVMQAVIHRAEEIYTAGVEQGLKENKPFKGVGKNYITFAITRPKLFQLLFMAEKENVPALGDVLPEIEVNYDKIIESVEEFYDLDREHAEIYYRHCWIYTHGIATLCATKMCRFTGEQISTMITEVSNGILRNMGKEPSDD